MRDKDINNLKEMLVDFNEYSTDYTKTRCRELEETIENTLKEIKRLQKENKKLKLCLGIVSPSRVLLEGKYWEKDDNKEIERLNNIIKEVREEIRILESNCDISNYQAQKLFQILDKGE